MTPVVPGPPDGAGSGPAGPMEWQRLHPLSPVLRGGRLLALALLVVLRQSIETLHVDNGRDAVPYLLGVPLVALLAVVQWRTTRWRVEDGDFRLETGVLRHRSRRVPLSRLQAVDLVRSPLARLSGLAELHLQAVGHEGSEATLEYLSLSEAHRVRAELLLLAGHQRPGPVSGGPGQPGRLPPATPGARAIDAVPAAPATRTAPGAEATDTASASPAGGHLLAGVGTAQLVASVALSGAAATFAGLVVAVALAAALGPRDGAGRLLAAVLPLLLSAGAVLQRRVAREYGFRLVDDAGPAGHTLAITHGLLETRVQSVPLDRVQAVIIHEPVLWRLLPATRGWVRMRVVVAGYRAHRGEHHRQEARTDVLLPVGPRRVAGLIVTRVLPGAVVGPPVQPAPRRARWLHPLQAPRLGLGVDAVAITVTGGWPGRTIDVVPHGKVQSWRTTQGPLERLLGLSTLHLDVAGHRGSVVAPGRDAAATAAQLPGLADLGRARRG